MRIPVKIGDVFVTNSGGKCTVIEYINAKSVLVMFEEYPCLVKCTASDLRLGKVKNRMKPSVYGKGYLGVGKYDGTFKEAYSYWIRMLERCYSELNPRLKTICCEDVVEVCEEWLNFQNFAEWCETQEFFNAKDIKGKSYHLDKDILVKGNKVYSPETCCFVPNDINILFRKTKIRSYPKGVSFSKANNLLQAQIKVNNKTISLGFYNSVDEAERAYESAEKAKFQKLAEFWKSRIPVEVYNRLISYGT